MYAYCLYCNTVKCGEVAMLLRTRFGYHAITPKIVQRKWIKGVSYEEIHDYLPGYVFMYTETPIESFRDIYRIEHVRRVLGNREAGSVLSGGDLAFARMLYDCDGTIGILKAYQEGDRVKLVKGALGDFEGEIIKLDRARGRAQIRYQFDGMVFKTWVGYEMIDSPGHCPGPQKLPRFFTPDFAPLIQAQNPGRLFSIACPRIYRGRHSANKVQTRLDPKHCPNTDASPMIFGRGGW